MLPAANTVTATPPVTMDVASPTTGVLRYANGAAVAVLAMRDSYGQVLGVPKFGEGGGGGSQNGGGGRAAEASTRI